MPSDIKWWKSLSPEWRQAFALTMLQEKEQPSDEELCNLRNSSVLRLAGPTAPYPNCNFALNDLSGIAGLQHLEILIVSHHQI
ncbi:MAG: leucine-rich repeat domain-containing protein, partial [Chitinophagaceae bacterium]